MLPKTLTHKVKSFNTGLRKPRVIYNRKRLWRTEPLTYSVDVVDALHLRTVTPAYLSALTIYRIGSQGEWPLVYMKICKYIHWEFWISLQDCSTGISLSVLSFNEKEHLYHQLENDYRRSNTIVAVHCHLRRTFHNTQASLTQSKATKKLNTGKEI